MVRSWGNGRRGAGEMKDDVHSLFYSGWILQQEGHVDDAIARFTQALELEPDFIKASYARGACFNIKGEYARAIDDYTVALEQDVRQRRRRLYARASHRRSRPPRRQATEASGRHGTLEGTLVRVPASCFVGNPECRFHDQAPFDATNSDEEGELDGLGDLLSSSQENNANASAEDLLLKNEHESASQENGTSTEERVNERGLPERDVSEATRHDLEEMEDVQRSEGTGAAPFLSDADPSEENTTPEPRSLNTRLLSSSQSQGSTDQTWQEIEEATSQLVHQPTDVHVRCRRAALFSQVGEFQEAIRDYSEALIYHPDNAALYFNRGILHDECLQFDEARRDFTSAIELDQTQPDFFNNRGFSYRKQGRLHQALEDYAKALDLKPEHRYAQTNQRIARRLLSHANETESHST